MSSKRDGGINLSLNLLDIYNSPSRSNIYGSQKLKTDTKYSNKTRTIDIKNVCAAGVDVRLYDMQ